MCKGVGCGLEKVILDFTNAGVIVYCGEVEEYDNFHTGALK